jgi:hypothetical protein
MYQHQPGQCRRVDFYVSNCGTNKAYRIHSLLRASVPAASDHRLNISGNYFFFVRCSHELYSFARFNASPNDIWREPCASAGQADLSNSVTWRFWNARAHWTEHIGSKLMLGCMTLQANFLFHGQPSHRPRRAGTVVRQFLPAGLPPVYIAFAGRPVAISPLWW